MLVIRFLFLFALRLNLGDRWPAVTRKRCSGTSKDFQAESADHSIEEIMCQTHTDLCPRSQNLAQGRLNIPASSFSYDTAFAKVCYDGIAVELIVWAKRAAGVGEGL